jgi:hypothetical protein
MNDLRVKIKKQFGIKRGSLQRMATKRVCATNAIHFALTKLAKGTRPGYEADEGALSDADIEAIRKAAEQMLPRGRVVKKRSLL